MKTPVFTGSATALVTPYGEDGVDYALLDQIIERQAENATALLSLEEELPGSGAEFIGLQLAGADCLALGVEQLDSKLLA